MCQFDREFTQLNIQSAQESRISTMFILQSTLTMHEFKLLIGLLGKNQPNPSLHSKSSFPKQVVTAPVTHHTMIIYKLAHTLSIQYSSPKIFPSLVWQVLSTGRMHETNFGGFQLISDINRYGLFDRTIIIDLHHCL
jgi:hypothetical protein